MQVKSHSHLDPPAAVKWGDGGGVSSVMPASGVERLCWLRAVVATSFDSFLVSHRDPVSPSPCLLLSLLLSVSIPPPIVCISASSCCLFSYVRCVLTFVVPSFCPSLRPRFPWFCCASSSCLLMHMCCITDGCMSTVPGLLFLPDCQCSQMSVMIL